MTDSTEHFDTAEELDNAMIPFRESMVKVFEKNWDCNMLAAYMADHSFGIEQDNYGNIICYPGLKEAPDGSLWRHDHE